MNRSIRNGAFRSALGLGLALVLAAAPALAQVRSSTNYAVTVDGIDSGGGASASASYLLRASTGQSFATPPMAGTNFNILPGLEATIAAAGGAFADTQPPSVPAGLAATPAGSSQIDLSWSAATDNGALTLYRVFRDGVFRSTVNAPTTGFGDTGLAPSTSYSYTVAACDAAGNCSVPSASASATTLADASSFTAALESGFNLIGNSLNVTLDVVALFGSQDAPVPGVTTNIVSVWKWNATLSRWAFHSPQLSDAGNAAYAASRNYDVLSVIEPGEGYWVNAGIPMTLPAQSGTDYTWNGFNFAGLVSGFNLIAHGVSITPSQFNNNVSVTPPSVEVIPTDNFVSLWAWDALLGRWYFYSPLLEASGGLQAVKDYADSRNYRHFQDFGKMLGIGTGFWVNRP